MSVRLPTMTATAAITAIDWLGMRLRVPATWEIVRHSVSEQRGRLTLVDRRRQRLMLAWSPCPDTPDWDHMLSDQQALETEQNPQATFERDDDCHGWHVLRRTGAEGMVVRAARYDRPRRRVIELVLPVRDEADADDEALVLESFEVVPQENDRAQRLRAFDVEVTPAPGWTLAAVDVTPGKAEVRWACGRAELTIRRLGLADTWFGGDVERYLKKELKHEPGGWSSVFHDGHPACRREAREAGPRIKAIVGRLRDRIDLAWFAPHANAVMHATLLRPRSMNIDIDAFDIRCLDALEPDA